MGLGRHRRHARPKSRFALGWMRFRAQNRCAFVDPTPEQQAIMRTLERARAAELGSE
jgi:hypothetical protein